MRDLVVERVPETVVVAELAASPHATAFNQPATLARLAERVDWWGVRQGSDWLLLWPLCTDAEGRWIEPVFTYYVGPVYTGRLLAQSPAAQLRWLVEAWAAALRTMTEVHAVCGGSLPLGLQDVRPLLWAAERTGLRLSLSPRYTALLEPLRPEVQADYSRSRRRAVRQGAALALTPGPLQAEPLVALYRQLFQRQGQPLRSDRLRQLPRLLDLADGSAGWAVGYYRPESEAPVAAAVFLTHRQTLNAVICVVEESWRLQGAISWILQQAIETAIARGVRVFDFNGANTLDRAVDKALYGAQTRLYFRFDVRAGA